MNEFAGVTPILNVRNFTASINYYVNKLGFRKRWDWGDPPTFGCVSQPFQRMSPTFLLENQLLAEISWLSFPWLAPAICSRRSSNTRASP
jgi:hypothetical protein